VGLGSSATAEMESGRRASRGPEWKGGKQGLVRIKATILVLAAVTAVALSSTTAFAWGTPSPSHRPAHSPTHSPTQSPTHSPTQSPTESPTKPPASPTITISPTSAETASINAANVAATSVPSPPVTGAGPSGDGGFSALLIALGLIIVIGGGLTLFFSRGPSSTS
jgi:hypothetical protein